MPRALHTFFLTALALVGLGILAFIIATTVGGLSAKAVESGSMEPTIPVGAVVITKPADAYRVGDVITFRADTRDGRPITHRIVSDRVQDGSFLYTTRGDANTADDTQEVAEQNVIGKVILTIPYLGFLFAFAQQPLGLALLIGVPTVLFVVQEGLKIRAELRKRRAERTEIPAEKIDT